MLVVYMFYLFVFNLLKWENLFSVVASISLL